jgi:proteic killer suppression protein
VKGGIKKTSRRARGGADFLSLRILLFIIENNRILRTQNMIKSFKCKETEKIFQGQISRKFPADIQTRSFNKLAAIHASNTLEDLKSPPSNHMEPLKGDRFGQYSIRIIILDNPYSVV